MKRVFVGRCLKVILFVAACASLTPPQAGAMVVTNKSTRDNLITDYISPAPNNYNTANYGGATVISVGYMGIGNSKSLIGFNVNMTNLPYIVNSVTLRLRVQATNFDSATAFNNNVYAISAANSNWVEGVGTNLAVNALGSTWNYKTGPGTNWAGSTGLSTAGTDYDSTLLSSVTFSPVSPPALNSAVDFVFSGTPAQLTTLIQGWTINMPGLLLQTSTSDPNPAAGFDRIVWYSREETTSGTGAYAPQLLIDFTLIPEPSSLALLTLGGGLMVLRRRKI